MINNNTKVWITHNNMSTILITSSANYYALETVQLVFIGLPSDTLAF